MIVRRAANLCNRVWSPVVGCTKISVGCRNCFALPHAVEMFGMTTPTMVQSRDSVTDAKRGSLIFVSLLGDLFHNAVSSSYIEEVLATVETKPECAFMVGTRRHERAMTFTLPANAIYAFTVSTQHDVENLSRAIKHSLFGDVFVLGIEPIIERVTIRDSGLPIGQIVSITCTSEKDIAEVSNAEKELTIDLNEFRSDVTDSELSRAMIVDVVAQCIENDIDLFLDENMLEMAESMIRWMRPQCDPSATLHPQQWAGWLKLLRAKER